MPRENEVGWVLGGQVEFVAMDGTVGEDKVMVAGVLAGERPNRIGAPLADVVEASDTHRAIADSEPHRAVDEEIEAVPFVVGPQSLHRHTGRDFPIAEDREPMGHVGTGRQKLAQRPLAARRRDAVAGDHEQVWGDPLELRKHTLLERSDRTEMEIREMGDPQPSPVKQARL
jgi:hypothetical protein